MAFGAVLGVTFLLLEMEAKLFDIMATLGVK
jgi:hypothetical protein